MKKKKIIGTLLTLCLLAGIPHTVSASSDTTDTVLPQEISAPVYSIAPETTKLSDQAIAIKWDCENDAFVKDYYIMRRATKNSVGRGAWKTIAEIESYGIKGSRSYSYTDKLKSHAPQQYEYKICILSSDETIDTRQIEYQTITEASAVLGTNIKICIDPGHFGTLNNNYDATGKDGNFPYSEAVFNLETAHALQTELKQAYGIDSYLTRNGASIALTYHGKTYKNENLDQKNIAVRGYMAKLQGCDLFLSLHTNSTSRQTKPWSQPKSINKAFVFVNQTAHADDTAMTIANAIGTSLTDYNREAGIQTAGFITRAKNKAASFSTLKNDAAKTNGTVIYRKNSSGSDYYGVLRGAAANGVPGILVEHAFHVTQIVRKLAVRSTDLSENWAACDAYGIALGFGFLSS